MKKAKTLKKIRFTDGHEITTKLSIEEAVLLEQAFELKSEIERWAEKKGIDTSDVEWYNNVVNDSIAVNGICKESLIEYIENND